MSSASPQRRLALPAPLSLPLCSHSSEPGDPCLIPICVYLYPAYSLLSLDAPSPPPHLHNRPWLRPPVRPPMRIPTRIPTRVSTRGPRLTFPPIPKRCTRRHPRCPHPTAPMSWNWWKTRATPLTMPDAWFMWAASFIRCSRRRALRDGTLFRSAGSRGMRRGLDSRPSHCDRTSGPHSRPEHDYRGSGTRRRLQDLQ